MPLPNFLIIGETKCGTTSLYDNLIQHPQILPTVGNGNNRIVDASVPLGVKELRFFDRNYHKGWDWYKSCFPECPEGCITGEATPMYLNRTLVLDRIASILQDNVKIIVMLRNPAERLLSHYHHMGKINNDWYKKYPTLWDLWTQASDQDYHLIERGVYWKSLFTLSVLFNDCNIHPVISEDMFTKPQEVMEDLFAFLGVDKADAIVPTHSRKNKYKKQIPQEIYDFYKTHNEVLEKVMGRELWRE